MAQVQRLMKVHYDVGKMIEGKVLGNSMAKCLVMLGEWVEEFVKKQNATCSINSISHRLSRIFHLFSQGDRQAGDFL